MSTRRAAHKFLISAFLLFVLAKVAQGYSSQECYSSEQVQCSLHQNCTDGLQPVELLTGRVRFPGTASSEERRFFRYFEGDSNLNRRYQGLLSDCSSICFSSTKNPKLALRPLSLTNTMSGHVPFDVVAYRMSSVVKSRVSEHIATDQYAPDNLLELLNQTVLLTTLRDVGSYAAKWYNVRLSMAPRNMNFTDISLNDWIESVRWRRNVLTRMLGAEPDRKSMPKPSLVNGFTLDMDAEVDREWLEDAYMEEQNALGPEKSPVFQLALERLKTDFAHFSLFHRLRESWDLLGHYFCWDMEKQQVRGEKARGVDAIDGLVGNKDEAARLWSRIQVLNRLDVALVNAADAMMDERIQVMKDEQASGVVCNFLNQVKVTCQTPRRDQQSSSSFSSNQEL